VESWSIIKNYCSQGLFDCLSKETIHYLVCHSHSNMTLAELLKTIASSSKEEWHYIGCWGSGAGPSYRSSFSFYEVYNGHPAVLHADAHGSVAIYKPNVSITIAFGLTANDHFREGWANQFPDTRASSHYVDVFFNNALVYRDLYVNVDGGRAKLPLPDSRDKLFVSKSYNSFIRLIDNLEGYISEYDQYRERAGFQVTDNEALGGHQLGDTRRTIKQELADFIGSLFTLSDIDELCFKLNINHEEIRGNTPKEKARELVLYCQRYTRTDELLKLCQELRPKSTL
jgi:hypothetical protein